MRKGSPLIIMGAMVALSVPQLAHAEMSAQSGTQSSELPPYIVEKVTQIPVYGDDECEPSVDEDEIVVCVRFDEAERFRIPPNLRDDPNNPRNQAWALRVRSLETVGAFGTDSCSPTGTGGFTGCTNQLLRNYAAEQENSPDAQAGRLIEQARQERLSRIDEEAALVEAAELERQSELEAYRKAREAEEKAAAEAAAAAESEDVESDLAVPPPAEDEPQQP
ncbi:MAG: hypothetical protein AAFX04_10985 [Pseudomonadota bacterium]